MKKFLLTLGVIFASLTASAQLVFVDAEGKELADGATVTMDKGHMNDFDEYQVNLEGISVKNTTDKGMRFNMTFQVTEIPSGSFTCCFGGTCLAPVSKPLSKWSARPMPWMKFSAPSGFLPLASTAPAR